MQGSKTCNRLDRALVSALVLVVLFGAGACAQREPQSLLLRDRIEKGTLTRSEIPRFRMSEKDLLEATANSSDFVYVELTELDKALLDASRRGDTAAMQQHIQAGARVNGVDHLGNTPLNYVAASGDLQRARLLLKERAELEGRGGVLTPLASAALRGHVHMVTLLLDRGADPDALGRSAVSPLVLAVRMNHLAVADALLVAGARADVKERTGDSLLMMTISKNQPAMADLLLRRGVDPDAVDAGGLSVLHWARQLKRVEIVQSLEQAVVRKNDITLRERKEQPFREIL